MWELVFLMVIMKIPIVYLCFVVWWAIRAEPRPLEGAAAVAVIGPSSAPGGLHGRVATRPRRGGPHGRPSRGYARPSRAALARAQARR